MTNPGRGRSIGRLGVGETWAIITALSYTATNVLLRAAAVNIDPWLGSMLRQIPVALLAWGMVTITRRPEMWPASERFLGWRFVAALVAGGSISFVIGNFLYFNALSSGGLGVTVSGSTSGMVLTGFLAGLIVLRERPALLAWVGAAILIGGLALVGVARGGATEGWLAGLFLAMGAGAGYASSNVLTRMVQRSRPTTFVALAGTSLGGLGPLLVIQLIRGGGNPLAGADADAGLDRAGRRLLQRAGAGGDRPVRQARGGGGGDQHPERHGRLQLPGGDPDLLGSGAAADGGRRDPGGRGDRRGAAAPAGYSPSGPSGVVKRTK